MIIAHAYIGSSCNKQRLIFKLLCKFTSNFLNVSKCTLYIYLFSFNNCKLSERNDTGTLNYRFLGLTFLIGQFHSFMLVVSVMTFLAVNLSTNRRVKEVPQSCFWRPGRCYAKTSLQNMLVPPPFHCYQFICKMCEQSNFGHSEFNNQ